MFAFAFPEFAVCRPVARGCRPCCAVVPQPDTVKVQLDLIEHRGTSLEEEEAVTSLKAAQAALAAQQAIAAAAAASNRQRGRLREAGPHGVGSPTRLGGLLQMGGGLAGKILDVCLICGEGFVSQDALFCQSCGCRRRQEAFADRKDVFIQPAQEEDDEKYGDDTVFIPWLGGDYRGEYAFYGNEIDDLSFPVPVPEPVEIVAEPDFQRSPRHGDSGRILNRCDESKEAVAVRESSGDAGLLTEASDRTVQQAERSDAAVESGGRDVEGCVEPTAEELEARRELDLQEARALAWVQEFLRCYGYADVNAKKRMRFRRSKYPLHTAVKQKSAHIAELLLWAGADPALKNSAGLTPRQLARMEGLGFTRTTRRTFHDEPYVITASGDAENVNIEVEHAEDGRRWCSRFAARFIEEITQRTGNSKKFDVFVRMLLSALSQESDHVYLDVLTARDLEMLRRHANPQGPPSTSNMAQPDKRYLILTYRGEFDKVHYPLPLPPEERSEEEALRAVVARLRNELDSARKQITCLEDAARSVSVGFAAPVSTDDDKVATLQRQNTELSDALRVTRREVEQLRAELRLRHAAGQSSDNSEVSRLKSQAAQQQAELKALREEARQKAQATKRESDQLGKELRSERQKFEKLQVQVRKLEDDLRRARANGAVRGSSAERSRAASRTPSVERAPSRPPAHRTGVSARVPSVGTAPRAASRASSRASSVASSRERTPSPSVTGRLPRVPSDASRPWQARQRGSSPARGGAQRPNAPSPSATLSPYKRAATAARRTPSPGQCRSRDRTPSPTGSVKSLGGSVGNNAPAPARRTPLSLREQSRANAAPPSPAPLPRTGSKPVSTRYAGYTGGAGGGIPADRRRSSSDANSVAAHQPGSLFGLAADLGIVGSSVESAGSAGGCHAEATSGAQEAAACDIDARLQALQSFLKQTKHISS